eukprot:15278056-Alexandrium_andersonii.AAC.1
MLLAGHRATQFLHLLKMSGRPDEQAERTPAMFCARPRCHEHRACVCRRSDARDSMRVCASRHA